MKIAIIPHEHPNTSLHGDIDRYLRDNILVLAENHEALLVSVDDGLAIDVVNR